MEYLRVQLKVCEGCGGLWYRTQSASEVYGRCCAGKLAEHARARVAERHGRRARRYEAMAMAGGAQ